MGTDFRPYFRQILTYPPNKKTAVINLHDNTPVP
jgi:hypothetical protein